MVIGGARVPLTTENIKPLRVGNGGGADEIAMSENVTL